MSKPIKILHLEDNMNDAELVKETLLLNEINCEIIHVDNKADFEKELTKEGLSIILADYNLPSFDGLAALALAKEKKPEVPFIFISGVLGEELAIETLKKGATDYVIKSRLERLTPALQRALREKEEYAQRIRLEREIVELEQMRDELQSIYQQLTRRVRGFIKIDLPSGKYSIVDKFLEDLSGYSINSWKEKSHFIKEIIHPEFTEYYKHQMNQLDDGIVPKMLEYKIRKKDGEERWWLQFNIGAFDIDGNLTSVSAVIIDNTEDKETHQKYQNLFENALMGMYRSDITTGEIIEANRELARILGFDLVDDLKKHSAFDFYPNKSARNELMDQLKEVGSYEEIQIQLRKIDGSLSWVQESARIYPDEGYVEGMMIDITDRKQAEDAIVRDRKAFQIIAEATIHSQNIPSLCQRITDGLIETFGYDVGFFVLYDSQKKLLETVAVSGNFPESEEVVYSIDIDNPDLLITLVARTGEALFIEDLSKESALSKYYNKEKPLGRGNISYPILDAENKLLGVLQFLTFDAKDIPEKDKALFETIADMFTTALEHQRSSNALQISEEKFRTFAEQSLLGVSIITLPGKFIFANEEFARITGYSQEELLQMKIRELTGAILTPERKDSFHSKITHMMKNLDPVKIQIPMKTREGREKWVDINVAPIFDASGEYTSSGAVILDITEQKRAQMTLERERQAFHILAEAVAHAKDIPELCHKILQGLVDVLQFDLGTFRLYDEKDRMLNPIAVTMVDKERIKEIQPISIDDETYLNTYVARTQQPVFAPDASQHKITKKYQSRLEKFSAKANITWPIVSTKGDLIGTIQIISNTPKELPEEDRLFFDTIIRFFATALERKWSEEALFESQAQYRRLVDTSPFVIINTDLDGTIIRVNHQAITIFGFIQESDFLGNNFFDFFVDDHKTKVIGHTESILKSGIISSDEYNVRNNLKKELIMDLSASVVLNDKNEPETLIFIGQDITTKKALEVEQNRLLNVVSYSDEVIISAAPDGSIISVNPSIETVFGYTQTEIIGKNISILVPPGEVKEQKAFINKALKHSKVTFETIRMHKDGRLIPVIINLSVNRGAKDKVSSINAIIVDISEIRTLEESLKSKYQEIEMFNNVITAGYRAKDLDEFLDSVLNKIIDTMNFTGGAIYLTDEVNQVANLQHSEGIPKNIKKGILSVKLDSPQFKRILVDGETVVLDSMPEVKKQHEAIGLHAIISVPFFSQQRIMGALMLISKEPREISEDEKQILESVGREIGTAIAKFKAEKELLTRQQNLRKIFDALDVYLLVVDVATGVVLNANKKTKANLGYKDADIGKINIFGMHTTHLEENQKAMLDELLSGKLKKFRMPVFGKGNKKIIGDVSVYKENYYGRDAIICLIQTRDEVTK